MAQAPKTARTALSPISGAAITAMVVARLTKGIDRLGLDYDQIRRCEPHRHSWLRRPRAGTAPKEWRRAPAGFGQE